MVLQCRPWPQTHHRSGRTPDFDHGFCADLPDGPQRRLRLCRKARRHCPRRSGGEARPRVFHQFRFRVSRYGAEDRHCLSARHRPGHPHHGSGPREGYHGVGFGGISVGGLVNNRCVFPQIPADHLRHTLDIEKNAFSKGLPANGIELADDLERLVQLHGAEKIAAVIVEPMSGSAGVILPPKGYLERIRATADKYGILLIFDEVITGFGRLGTPFAVDYFGVVPDLVTTAKGLTNGAIPMGAVFAARKVYDGLMTGPENAIELFHGYTYSGHPVASAAGLATLEIYAEEGLLTRGAGLADYWQEALHSLKGAPNVIDIRNLGLVGAVELASRKDAPGARAYDIFVECFKKGLLIRVTGDVIALSPPLIIEKEQIDTIISVLGDAIKRAA
ncbi:beta alanine-pyruvate transaminase [Brucella pinnipedialis M163/99/10]|nr:beta alanine-pyruvate transaminase [Brucella pinnipedialis M163/99/10]